MGTGERIPLLEWGTDPHLISTPRAWSPPLFRPKLHHCTRRHDGQLCRPVMSAMSLA